MVSFYVLQVYGPKRLTHPKEAFFCLIYKSKNRLESDLINSTENLKHAWLPNTIRIKEHVICKKRISFCHFVRSVYFEGFNNSIWGKIQLKENSS